MIVDWVRTVCTASDELVTTTVCRHRTLNEGESAEDISDGPDSDTTEKSNDDNDKKPQDESMSEMVGTIATPMQVTTNVTVTDPNNVPTRTAQVVSIDSIERM